MKTGLIAFFPLLLAWPWTVYAENPSLEAQRNNAAAALEGKTPPLSKFSAPKIDPRKTHAVAQENKPKPAMDFQFKKDDKSVSFKEEFKGKVVLLDFWFVDCKYCRFSTPLLHKLGEKYAEKGLTIIGMNTDDERGYAEKYVQAQPETKGHQAFYNMQRAAQLYGVRGYPHFVLIGADGNILARAGYPELSSGKLEPLIEAALKNAQKQGDREK